MDEGSVWESYAAVDDHLFCAPIGSLSFGATPVTTLSLVMREPGSEWLGLS